MPNKAAAIKALRQTKKHTVKNQRAKVHIKSLTHQFAILIKDGKKPEAIAAGQKLQQALGKAAKTHVFHKNKAANRTSTLYKTLARLK